MNDLTLNIYILSRLTHNHYAREFRKIHLTMGQFSFVLGIARNDGISQEKLSTELRISKSTTASIIRQLLNKGFVFREVDENDRRNFKLHLTETGKTLIPQIEQVISDCHQMILQGLSPQDRKIFLKQLNQIRLRAEQTFPLNPEKDVTFPD